MSYDIPYFIVQFEATEEKQWQQALARYTNNHGVLSFCCAFSQRVALHHVFQCHHGRVNATMYAHGTKHDLGHGEPTPRLRMLAALRWMQDQRPKAMAMPDPRTVWLYRSHKYPEWCLSIDKPIGDWEVSGPHRIVPGMMSLDELWDAHQIRIEKAHRAGWTVFDRLLAERGVYDNAVEAQWAATCLAKGVAV